MSGKALEVELDHGHIKACDGTLLPEHARGILTLLPKRENVNRLKRDPALAVTFLEDPTAPLEPEDWPEAFA